MEIQTYKLKQDHEEFKDLSEQQLMAIAELCLDYYKLGQYSTQEDAQSDRQDEIDELQNENDELQDQIREFSDQYDNLEELIKECYFLDSSREIKEEIQNFCNYHGYRYKWDWIEDKK